LPIAVIIIIIIIIIIKHARVHAVFAYCISRFSPSNP